MANLPAKPAGMSQTNFVFAILFVTFFVFVTLKGDLAKWLAIFGFGGNAGGTAANPAAGASTPAAPAGISALPGLPALPGLSSAPPVTSGLQPAPPFAIN